MYLSTYLEILAFCLGYTLLHQGVAQLMVSKTNKRAVCFITTGVGVLFLGSIYWQLNSDASTRLAATQSLSVAQPNFVQQKIDLEGIESSQRRLASLKLAGAQFISGAEDVKVLTAGGQWVAFVPAFEDWKEREKYLQMVADMKQKKVVLDADAVTARRTGMQWLISIFIAIGTGLFWRWFQARSATEMNGS